MKLGFCYEKFNWSYQINSTLLWGLKSLKRRKQKDDTMQKCYQEAIDTENKADYLCKIEQVKLNDTVQFKSYKLF